MKRIVVGVVLLVACSRKDDAGAPAGEPSTGATKNDGEWKPRHRDKKATDMPSMATRTYTTAFGKLGVRATITVPELYVVGKEMRGVNEVRELPADACTDDRICGLTFHAESLHFPTFNLRVGSVPSGDKWTCDDKRCAYDERKVSENVTEVRFERVHKVGENRDGLYCTTSLWGVNTPNGKVTPEVEAWMIRVCEGITLVPL
jgi:hypothetical protein